MPKLVHELDYNAALVIHDVGPTPAGHRVVATVTGGDVAGDRVKGSFVGAGADWLLVGADGFGRLDVRATIQTVDGALIYVQYFGLIEVTPQMSAILGGADDSADFGGQYFFTNPRMETSDPRYAWVNTTMFLGQGRLVPGPTVEYRLFRVEND
jgi:hypothetical protein